MLIPPLIAQIPVTANEKSELPDIQDIIPPEALPNYLSIALAIIGGLIFIGGLIYAIIYFSRKDKRPAQQISAGRIALKKLDDLESQASSLSANVFSLQVSDILKDYLNARFQDSFRYETSEEFIQRLSQNSSNSLPQNLQQNLANFVGICDELKFARPAHADSNKLPLLEKARHIIHEPISINAAPSVS